MGAVITIIAGSVLIGFVVHRILTYKERTAKKGETNE